MLQPPPEILAVLNPTERRWYHFADYVNRRLKFLSVWWIATFMRFLLWFCGGRRFRVRGQDVLRSFSAESRVLMVANHRSFFDFYTVAYANVSGSVLGKRCFFPVRSTFFYDGPLGAAVNWCMTVMAMFPPILRRPEGRTWNRWALRRLNAELQVPGTWVGIHPEGTRNVDLNPWSFRKAHAGAGQIALAVDGIRTIPLLVLGMSNNIVLETWRNWTNPAKYPIYIWYGPDVDFGDLRARAEEPEAWRLASERCMEAIAELAVALQEELATTGGPPPVTQGT
jgi:1-acyl-sn-glycerol-3-phosphate acyltransferase